MTQIIYSDRSRVQTYQRCKRLRWLEYSEGQAGVGLVPARKSIHLVVGSAVHSGMEVLLREGQAVLDDWSNEQKRDANIPSSLAMQLDAMFVTSAMWEGSNGRTVARGIEDHAVAAALADLQKEMGEAGVELDPEEQAAALAAKQADGTAAPEVDIGGLVAGMSSNSNSNTTAIEMDSPIVIEFAGMVPTAIDPSSVVIGLPDPLTPQTSMGAVRVTSGFQSNEDYLREEIASLVEGLVRAWSRRRWRETLSSFEIIEVEREGEWRLAYFRTMTDDGVIIKDEGAFINFLSRHDALLLERSTNYLYLQSFKTTGSWDRRKEMDAQVDMQGLSEAVDVEKRFAWYWEVIHRRHQEDPVLTLEATAKVLAISYSIAKYLDACADPPQILGVRYEYLLKGSRKKDKKDAMNPDRYVQESILCRAWKQEGITSDDRRWSWTYDWNDETGKSRRLDYRSWQKSAVWKHMAIADWIDLLDEGKVQEGALTEQGEPMDALASQFVPVLTVYRNSDEMLDLLEQIESQEVQIARDVAAVRQAEENEGYAGKRTALNRLFPQTRTACSYPGVCQYRTTSSQPGFCFGASDPFHDPVVLERFQERKPNHPKEGLVKISHD